MAERVRRAALESGLEATAAAGLVRAYRAAMAPRESGPAALDSERHPDFLHPGRTTLILLRDLEERDPWVLAIGALAESRRPELRLPAPDVAGLLDAISSEREPGEGRRAFEWWCELPSPEWGSSSGLPAAEPAEDADARLLERIVVAPPAVQRVTLAEALDVLRHAHLRTSEAERRRAVELAERVFAPVASRVAPTLDRRFGWWIRRVGAVLRRP